VTVDETLELARSHDVGIRLNATGDGIDLEIETDPPQALMNILRHAKHDLVETLRWREIDRRRPLIVAWINDHFVSTPPGVCRHCEGAGSAFVHLYCGDASGDVHASCQKAWREVEEAKARAALGLVPLVRLSDRHQPLLAAVEDSRPPDVTRADWTAAIRGLRTFLTAGWGDKAEAEGWPLAELYLVPELWSQVHLCGAALLIGDREVVEVTPTRIGIKTASGSVLSFYRKPVVDYRVAYEAHLKAICGNYPGDSEEPRLRAVERTVVLFRSNNPNASLEDAKRAVLALLV
jgi:hypothetical protein